MEATIEKNEASCLEGHESEPVARIVKIYNQISGETNKLFALGFLEGMAAASKPVTSPQAPA